MNAAPRALTRDDNDVHAQAVGEFNKGYLGLKRHDGEAAAILQGKLSALRWRASVLRRLLAPAGDRPPAAAEALANALVELGLYLHEAQQARLAELLPDRDLFAHVMARQGVRLAEAPRHHRAAGPGIDLDIQVNRGSAWPFSRWKEIAEFSEYEYRGEGVLYRGVLFRPGDVVLANVNLDGNSIYSALSDPKGYCSHCAVFAVLCEGERQFPAVIETYEKGLRAVPLNVFMGPRYTTYAEIYRHQELAPTQYAAVNAAAQTALGEIAGYNFYTVDGDPRYVSCTTVGQLLFQAAGLAPLRSRSAIADKVIQRNLQALGYERYEPFFAPVDYLLSPELVCVGWIDNNQLDRLLTRELIEARLRVLFASGRLDCRRFPRSYRLNLWGIGHMRRQTPLGTLVSRVTGFDHASLPKGPDRMVAAIEPVEAQLGLAVRRTLPFVRDYLATIDHVDLTVILNDPRVQAVLERNLRLSWLHI